MVKELKEAKRSVLILTLITMLLVITLGGLLIYIGDIFEHAQIRYKKPQEINITIDSEFTSYEIKTIQQALEQYNELENIEIGSMTVGKFNKKADIMITPVREEAQYYDSDDFPNALGCNYHKIKGGKIKGGKITKSIITINKKLLAVYANTQAKASLILSGSEIPFEHFYNNYLTSVTLHEFGHTLGMPDLMDDMYFNKSIMHYANFELIELTEYDKGSIEARYRSETK